MSTVTNRDVSHKSRSEWQTVWIQMTGHYEPSLLDLDYTYCKKKKKKKNLSGFAGMNGLRGMDTFDTFSHFLTGEIPVNYYFAFLHIKPLLESGLLYKERICSLWEQILSFYSRPLFQRGSKTILTELPPLKAHPFLLNWAPLTFSTFWANSGDDKLMIFHNF